MLETGLVMNNKQAENVRSTTGEAATPGFIRRHRLPLFLAVVAVCLYVTSILYILYGRGSVA